MKNYQLLFLVLLFAFAITGCCDTCCPDPTEAKCTELYPCPESPPSTCDCAAGVTMKIIDKTVAQTYINKATTDITTFKSGILIDACQVCLIANEKPQKIATNIGLMGDGTAIIVAKYIITDGSDSVYVNITGSDPGGPICPPGTKCN